MWGRALVRAAELTRRGRALPARSSAPSRSIASSLQPQGHPRISAGKPAFPPEKHKGHPSAPEKPSPGPQRPTARPPQPSPSTPALAWAGGLSSPSCPAAVSLDHRFGQVPTCSLAPVGTARGPSLFSLQSPVPALRGVSASPFPGSFGPVVSVGLATITLETCEWHPEALASGA